MSEQKEPRAVFTQVYNKTMDLAVEVAGTNGLALLVAHMRYADFGTGQNSWPSIATLTKVTGMSRATIKRVRTKLVEAGILIYQGVDPRTQVRRFNISLPRLAHTEPGGGSQGATTDIPLPISKNPPISPRRETTVQRRTMKNHTRPATQEEVLVIAKRFYGASTSNLAPLVEEVMEWINFRQTEGSRYKVAQVSALGIEKKFKRMAGAGHGQYTFARDVIDSIEKSIEMDYLSFGYVNKAR